MPKINRKTFKRNYKIAIRNADTHNTLTTLLQGIAGDSDFIVNKVQQELAGNLLKMINTWQETKTPTQYNLSIRKR